MLEKIARIQDKIGTLVKDTKAYNYKYVDLNQIIEKLTPLLREEGLVLTQPILDGSVITIIEDAKNADDSISSEIPLPLNLDPQKLGSAITYFRRYTLVSLLALTSEEDDDGASSSGLSSVLSTIFLISLFLFSSISCLILSYSSLIFFFSSSVFFLAISFFSISSSRIFLILSISSLCSLSSSLIVSTKLIDFFLNLFYILKITLIY
jgi:hypothetical protein